MTTAFEVHGACALVTGASRGIGCEIARQLAKAGAHVALTARTAEPLQALAAELRAHGVRAVPIAGDLGRMEDRERIVAAAEKELGAIDVLVNNAAIESEGAFTDLSLREIAATVELNLVAPMHLALLVLPRMKDRQRGRIVNIASGAGKKALPYSGVYSGTKAGLIEWSSALRAELRETGVSVSTVCPGFVTGEGMFARSGLAPLPLVGSTTPQRVAAVVLRALRTDAPEIIVNSMPLRPLLALGQLSPRLSARIVDVLGITGLQRRRVQR